jgi:hypothetical protein
MRSKPDLEAVNKWVTDKRMEKLVGIARTVLTVPIKGLTIDTTLRANDADVIGLMLLSQIQDETGAKLIFTEATKIALQEAAQTWFLAYLEELDYLEEHQGAI